MRVAHFTDLHVYRPHGLRSMFGKRLVGAANLYLAGRVKNFSDGTVEALVASLLELEPDVVLCTGDLTAMASPEEFEAARDLLEPITSRFPFFVIPGNHDVYTRGSQRSRRFESYFGRWSGGGRYPALFREGGMSFVGVDASRPHPLLASGRIPRSQLDDLASLLSGELQAEPVVLLVHYPLLDRAGGRDRRWARYLENAEELVQVVAKAPNVKLILHGHEHHGFRSEIPTPTGAVPVANPGAGGMALLPEKGRTAHFNVYRLGAEGLDGLDRYAFDGQRFRIEEGAPYSTGQ